MTPMYWWLVFMLKSCGFSKLITKQLNAKQLNLRHMKLQISFHMPHYININKIDIDVMS